MSYGFNADEIFEVAEQIERNGAAFYRKAAGRVAESKMKDLFVSLAEMEDNHEAIFVEMRASLTDKDRQTLVFDPLDETTAYLRALADRRVFDQSRRIDKLLAGADSPADILRTAIGLEEDSIAFYAGMQNMVEASHGRERITAIIREEMTHVTQLNGQLQSL